MNLQVTVAGLGHDPTLETSHKNILTYFETQVFFDRDLIKQVLNVTMLFSVRYLPFYMCIFMYFQFFKKNLMFLNVFKVNVT